MLIDRKHIPWGVATGALTLGAIGLYSLQALSTSGQASGGSTIGLLLGGSALGIMFFCAGLSMKRKAPHWRVGKAQTWLRAHVWLGLLTVALVALHACFSLGHGLALWLWALLLLVTVSGVFGVILQQFIPRLLLHSVPGETVAQQVSRQMENLRGLAEQVVKEFAGSLEHPSPQWPPTGSLKQASAPASVAGPAPVPAHAPPAASGPVAGAPVVASGAIAAASAVATAPPPVVAAAPAAVAGAPVGAPAAPPAPAPPAPPAGGEPLRRFYLDYVRGFLDGRRTPLDSTTRTESLLGALRTMTPPHIHPGVNELEEMIARRRLLVRQRRLMRALTVWLIVHVPMSWALLLLAVAHAIAALRYGGA